MCRYRELLFAVLTGLVPFISCRPPYIPVEFRSNHKWKDTYSLQVEDRDIRIRFIAGGDVSCGHDYRLHLDVRVDGRRLSERLKVATENLQVMLGQVPLSLHIEKAWYGPWITNERYSSEIGYYLDASHVDAWDDSVESNIRIIDHGFLAVDGVPLRLDTVYARDPKLHKLCGK